MIAVNKKKVKKGLPVSESFFERQFLFHCHEKLKIVLRDAQAYWHMKNQFLSASKINCVHKVMQAPKCSAPSSDNPSNTNKRL